MTRSENTISAALDAAFEYSTRPGLYMLDGLQYAAPACPQDIMTNDVGLLCNATYGVASGVDVDSDLSGRNNRMPRGLYDMRRLDPQVESLPASKTAPMAETAHTRRKGPSRGLAPGPIPERIGFGWVVGGVDVQDTAHIVPEQAGMPRAGFDARLAAKDSVAAR